MKFRIGRNFINDRRVWCSRSALWIQRESHSCNLWVIKYEGWRRALEIPLIRRHRSSIDRLNWTLTEKSRACPPPTQVRYVSRLRRIDVRFLLILSRPNRKNLNYNAGLSTLWPDFFNLWRIQIQYCTKVYRHFLFEEFWSEKDLWK